jgi:hypothetical protein
MTKITKIILLLALAGCSSEKVWTDSMEKSVCVSREDKRELAAFIIKCAEAANPKSDEEGEDLVKQCEWTGERVLCPTQTVCRTNRQDSGFAEPTHWGDWGPCKTK